MLGIVAHRLAEDFSLTVDRALNSYHEMQHYSIPGGEDFSTSVRDRCTLRDFNNCYSGLFQNWLDDQSLLPVNVGMRPTVGYQALAFSGLWRPKKE